MKTATPALRPGCAAIIDVRALNNRCSCGAVPDGPFARVHPPALWQFATHARACLTNTTPRDFR